MRSHTHTWVHRIRSGRQDSEM